MTPGTSDTVSESEQTRDVPAGPRRDDPARRKPWIAVALTVLSVGLGHLYVGRPRRAAIVWMLSSVGFVALVALAMSLRGVAQLVAFSILVVAGYALPATDAARIARATGHAYRPRWYNRWYVYAGLLVLAAFTWQPWIKRWIMANVTQAFRIPASSMAPTVVAGDYILAKPWRGDIARGDIVVYRRSGEAHVIRVIGLPGDTIAMNGGRVSIAGRALPEPYLGPDTSDASYPELAWQRAHLGPGVDRTAIRPSMRSWGPLVVPAGAYFLLGDNRGASFDSRFIGYVARDAIVKQPTVIYFSRDRETGEVRWTRIGRDLRR